MTSNRYGFNIQTINDEQSIYNNPNFPELTIKEFVAIKLDIPEHEVLKVLLNALPIEKQIHENNALLEKALTYSVNASGAIILMINTNDGLKLVCGYSQRRKRVVASNGACEKLESMAQTAMREFTEELGNPDANGLLNSIVKNPLNCRSLALTNQIGETKEQIANRIIEKKASKFSLYVNISAMYVNAQPVNYRRLSDEIELLNKKLEQGAPFYKLAVGIIFPPKDSGVSLDNAATKEAAIKMINDFKEQCQSNISSNFISIFDQAFNADTAASKIKAALEAIIDLTENSKLELVSKDELIYLLSLDRKNPDVLKQFEQEYFAPAFENILKHQKDRQPVEYINSLERLASNVSQMTLGGVVTSEKPKDIVQERNNSPTRHI